MASAIRSMATTAITSATNTAKVTQLQKDTFDLQTSAGLTTDHGVKVSNTDDWLKVTDGQAGPSLLEDQISREKIHRFDHERIPERVVHARGVGAHGYFKAFGIQAAKYTFAPVLTDSLRTTPVFVRFSTVAGSRGSADTVRDVRGFAIKFYTEEGNWDLVGNNIPVFFIQDAVKFPDVIHAVKPEPDTEVPQAQTAHNNFWDFMGLQSETAHMIMWAMSDRAIPRSFRMMQGFGVNTFTLINANGERHFVKFHLIPELGVHSLMWDETMKIGGQDPDFHRRDLYEAINNGCPPKWTFAIQVIEEARERDFEFDILDATKVWPEELVPIQPIGELVLNRNVDEFFPETEQVAFCTSHVVPGIGFSDDPLLQGRNFSYFDTQISRLGLNWEQIPINTPVCPVMNHHRDGQHQRRIVAGPINYWPNRRGWGAPQAASEGGYQEYPQKVVGMKKRVRGSKFQEHFNQAQLFYNSLTPVEKLHLTSALCFELSHCDDPEIYRRYTEILNQIDFELAKTVAMKINGVVPDAPGRRNHGQSSPQLSQLYYAPKSPIIASRRIAVLVADGFNETEVQGVRAALSSANALTFIVGPRRGKVLPAEEGGEGLVADHHWEGQRSTLFDAVFIPSGARHVQALSDNGRAVHWVEEAFGHCKAIGAIGEGVGFVQRAFRDIPDLKFASNFDSDEVVTSYGVVTMGKYGVASAVVDALSLTPGAKGFVSNFGYQISKHRCYERELDGLINRVCY